MSLFHIFYLIFLFLIAWMKNRELEKERERKLSPFHWFIFQGGPGQNKPGTTTGSPTCMAGPQTAGPYAGVSQGHIAGKWIRRDVRTWASTPLWHIANSRSQVSAYFCYTQYQPLCFFSFVVVVRLLSCSLKFVFVFNFPFISAIWLCPHFK